MTTSSAPTASETRTSFEAETERHLAAFWHEITEPSSFRPMPSVIVMAAELLAREHGVDASWERFDMSAFFDHVVQRAYGFCAASQSERYHGTLVAFLAFLAERGVVASEVVERARAAPLPPEYAGPSVDSRDASIAA